MSKGKAAIILITLIIVMLAVALFAATQSNMLLSGDYYVQLDNAHLSQNEDTGGIIHLGSGKPYIYELNAANETGDEAKITFGVSRELRQDAYLRLELQPIRGVVSWSEVAAEELPPEVANTLN